MEIIANERIKSLEKFYARDASNSKNIIEENYKSKKTTDDAKGIWVTEQFKAAAVTLHVSQFIEPLENGGEELPEIPPLNSYVEAHALTKKNYFDELVSTLDTKEFFVETLKDSMIKYQEKARTLKRELAAQETIEEGDEELLEKAEYDFQEAYSKWSKQYEALQDDKEKIHKWEEDCQIKAIKQRGQDTDALNRATDELAALKRFLRSLMNKIPSVVDTVTTKREDGRDPYETSDMRCIYHNLCMRYRKNDEMGLMTTILLGMIEKQGNQTLEKFVRDVENFHQDLVKLNVKVITISDLAAFVALAGMNEEHRIDFFKKETMLELALENMEDANSYGLDGHGDDMASVATTRLKRRTLFTKVQQYVKSITNVDLINSRMTTNSKKTQQQDKLTKPTTNDNTQQLYVTENGKPSKYICNEYYYGNGQCPHAQCKNIHLNYDQCRAFALYGKCNRRDTCKKKHDDNQTKKATGAKVPTKTSENKTSVAKALLAIGQEADSWGNSSESTHMVITHDVPVPESVMLVNTRQRLGWDTMASINVASSLDMLDNPQRIQYPKSAMGIGGTRMITHTGYCPKYNLYMNYIEGGCDPNLLSVAKALQPDRETGVHKVAIFTATGAARYNLSTSMRHKLAKLMEEMENDGNLDATAVMRNGVYEQTDNMTEICNNKEEESYAVTMMYGNRAALTSEEELVGMLVSAGISQSALVAGVENGSIKGLPKSITTDIVNNYFVTIGKDTAQLEAEITTAPLTKPIDYAPESTTTPGEIMMIDAFDPPYSRVDKIPKPQLAIGGYKDVVMVQDVATGYCDIVGRNTKKNPQAILRRFILQWKAKWNTLKMIKMDKEFITSESYDMCKTMNITPRQAVPGDHRRGIGGIEGCIRWIEDSAQAHMNRARILVEKNIITQEEHRTFWYHATRLAVIASNARESKLLNGKTRYEEGTGEIFNLSYIVLLPFGTRLVAKKLLNTNDGRGTQALYLGPSLTIRGGIIVYNLKTKRISQKYSFIPRVNLPNLDDLDIPVAAEVLYGNIISQAQSNNVYLENTHANKEEAEDIGPEQIDSIDVEEEGEMHRSDDIPDDSDRREETLSEYGEENTMRPNSTNDMHEENSNKVMEIPDGGNVKPKQEEPIEQPRSTRVRGGCKGRTVAEHPHYTRSKNNTRDIAMAVESRPPKPNLPSSREAARDPRWWAADKREVDKLVEESVFTPLPRDEIGKYIFPEGAIFMNMFRRREIKWKPLPEDAASEGWVECMRLVGDGSTDTRDVHYYAETPNPRRPAYNKNTTRHVTAPTPRRTNTFSKSKTLKRVLFMELECRCFESSPSVAKALGEAAISRRCRIISFVIKLSVQVE